MSLMSSTQAIFIICLVLVAARSAYNWHKLRKAPGPFLASISNLWRAYYQFRGQLRQNLLSLHEKHGTVVRYGSNSISISDPDVIGTIYSGARRGFTIHDSYKVLLGFANGKEVSSIVSTEDEARHGQLRRGVANVFTPAAILEMENLVHDTAVSLIEVLERQREIDLSEFMLWYSFDAVGRIAFSEDLGCLRSQSDVNGYAQAVRDRFSHWGTWSSIPELERLVFRNPIARHLPASSSGIARLAATRLQERMSAKENPEGRDLLQRFIETKSLDPQGMISTLLSTISGAADTTPTTMVATMYYLLKHPATLAKLRAELDKVKIARPVPEFSETKDLPYLNAVIKEAMRLFPVLNWPMERRVPAGGIVLAGTFLPENTSVGCFALAVHQNKSIYGDDVEAFRPERWLECDPETLKKMERSHLGFSRGKRVCLGQNIAIMQMKKVIPALILRFDMSFVDPNTKLEADFSPAVVMMKPLKVRLTAI